MSEPGLLRDPSRSTSDRPESFIPPSRRSTFDKNVTFEEYLYYAKLTRSREDATQECADIPQPGFLEQIFRRGPAKVSTSKPPRAESEIGRSSSNEDSPAEKRTSAGVPQATNGFEISENEWSNAARMMRTASWAACFYLITTDVLGPYGVAFAMGTLGWGPGIALYTVFAFMAGYCGYLLWLLFLGLDSYEFPIRNYGDLVFRTYGNIPRYCVNILQTIQLLLVVGQVIIQNGQGMSQVSKFRLCYVVCIVVFVIAGFAVGQVRSLRNFGFISAIAVGLNLLVIFISMGVVANSPPNYGISVLGSSGAAVAPDTVTPDANGVYPPVQHYNGLPGPNSLVGSINGLMSGVFAYGGAQIFPEIMAEMRRPRDFIKSIIAAEFFIWAVYLIYGCFVYYYQGQYAFQISYIGISVYGFQVVCDMMAALTGLVAAGLYANIGIKVLYNNVFMEIFNAPPINTKQGRYIFTATVPIYWSLAFVVAAAIPNYFGFVSVIASFCVVQFSYTFPPLLYLAYVIQRDARLEGEGFDATTGLTKREDSGTKRLIRGFLGKDRRMKYVNVWHVVLVGGSLATAGLGAYAAIQGIVQSFRNPQVNAFTCRSPLDLSPRLG